MALKSSPASRASGESTPESRVLAEKPPLARSAWIGLALFFAAGLLLTGLFVWLDASGAKADQPATAPGLSGSVRSASPSLDP